MKGDLSEKKVYCSLVNCTGTSVFESVLLDINLISKVLPYKNKEIELSHVTDEGNCITGLFVATQTKEIAPIHTPGNHDDYSAVALGAGQGFAYPNVFLYLKSSKILLWESNRLGLLESGMEYYFNTISTVHFSNSFNVSLSAVMNLEASQRLNKLVELDSIEIQIAEPKEYLRTQAVSNGSLNDIYDIVNKVNASKSIYIKIKAEDDPLNKLNRTWINRLASNFFENTYTSKSRVQNKLIVSGKRGSEDGAVEETINFVTDRLKDSFKIEKLVIAPHLQINERKEGIRMVNEALKPIISELFRPGE